MYFSWFVLRFRSDFAITPRFSLRFCPPKEIIEKKLSTGLKRMRDNSENELLKQENEDAYFEIRLQMHNRLIKKLHLLKEEWKLDNISQVTERIMLAFFKNDLE